MLLFVCITLGSDNVQSSSGQVVEVVWFAKSISQHAFICRLAVRFKLTTKDRMAKWGFGGVLLCVMQIEIGEQKLVPNSIKMPF